MSLITTLLATTAPTRLLPVLLALVAPMVASSSFLAYKHCMASLCHSSLLTRCPLVSWRLVLPLMNRTPWMTSLPCLAVVSSLLDMALFLTALMAALLPMMAQPMKVSKLMLTFNMELAL